MTWLVFAVSLVLVLVGAVSVISGAPVVQIERGWTEVIAGSVAISGGAITFALGAVLVRLQVLTHAVRLKAGVTAAPDPMPAEPVAADESLRPTLAPEEALFVAEPAAADEVRTSLWKRMRQNRDEEQEPAADVVPRSEPEVDSDRSQAAIAELDEESARAAQIVAADDSPTYAEGSEPRRLLAPSSDLSGVERSTLPGSASRDWMTQPLLRSRSPKVMPPEPPPLFEGPPERDETAPELGQDAPSAEPNWKAPLVEAQSNSESDSEEPADMTTDEVTVIGRYQAGASAYTMYSDGAIDVETEAGDLHRFGSMDELKEFIARQESALS